MECKGNKRPLISQPGILVENTCLIYDVEGDIMEIEDHLFDIHPCVTILTKHITTILYM